MKPNLLLVGVIGLLSIFPHEPEAASTPPASPGTPFSFAIPKRAPGQKDVLALRCAPIENVRVAFIGVGNRGSGAVRRFTHIEGATIAAIVDVTPQAINRCKKTLKKYKHQANVDYYSGDEDWKKVCERKDIDLIYICTGWSLHTPMALYAMNHGKHVSVEVPAATTVENCWKLVDTAEKTQRHCMMMENCNYDFFEMAVLNMAQKGLLGEIMHTEGAYIHDLRKLTFNNHYWHQWRLKESALEDGCLYPTHGIGPIAHIMNIHRGDKMNFLVSISTDPVGMKSYAEKVYGENSEQAKIPFAMGDMNTTIIKTEKGKTMLVQHDVVSPRPYDRIFKVSGTEGYAQKYPGLPKDQVQNNRQAPGLKVGSGAQFNGLSFEKLGHNFLSAIDRDKILDENRHPLTKIYQQMAKKVGGHGGMDYIMDARLIYCLNHGLPLDQDVYDAAEWSVIVPLTKKSCGNNGMPVAIPDFTRGAWEKLDKLKYYMKGE